MRTAKTILLVLLVAAGAQAQMATNLARGFDPEKVYQIGDVDNVNVFNGNLIIDIPVGPTFSVGGNLKYGFHLVYNGNPWNYANINGLAEALPSRFNNVAIGWQLTMGELSAPFDPESGSLSEDGNWVYAGPDGSERPFSFALHWDESGSNPKCPAPCIYSAQTDVPVNGVAGYTVDSSYLRLIRIGPVPVAGGCRSRYRLDFPDGTHHVFESVSLVDCAASYSDEESLKYRLAEMDDNFGNNVTLQYDSDTSPTAITVSDSTLIGYNRRTHTIHLGNDPLFYQYPGDACSVNSDLCTRRRVYQVDLAGPPDTSGQPTTSTYSFDITPPTTVSLPCGDQTILGDRTASVRFLEKVHRPDTSTYATWDASNGPYYTQQDPVGPDGYIPCSPTAAHINRLNLPTGGHIVYVEAGRQFPRIPTDNADPDHVPTRTWDPKNAAFATTSIGLTQRSLYTSDDDPSPATWKYEASLENPAQYQYLNSQNQWVTVPVKQEEVVRITDPAGFTTAHYFDVFRLELTPYISCFTGGVEDEYGLPFTRRVTSNGAFLSTESFPGPCNTWNGFGTCPVPTCKDGANGTGNTLTPKRRTYVKYDYDRVSMAPTDHWGTLNNGRLANSRTEFVNTDGSLSETDTVSSDFDGLGHYRVQTTTSTIGSTPTRTTTTHYNSNTNAGTYDSTISTNDPSQYMILPSKPWLTALYDRIDTAEGTNTARQEFSFNTDTGFLNSRRTLASGTTESSNDLLASFTSTDHGNVTHESYSGGDLHNLGSGITDYAVTHTYTAGTLATTTYDGASFKSVDNDIDPYTGLVTASRDSSLLTTTYGYDSMYRIILERQPAGGAATKLGYPLSPLGVTVDRYSVSDTTYSTPLIQQRYYYDGLGRLIESKNLMPDGWSTAVKQYDGLGRVSKAYAPEYHGTGAYETYTPSNYTSYVYDFLGRATSTTAPDGSQLVQSYDGAKSMTHVTRDSNNADSPAGNGVTENYDGHGRLSSVVQKSGPTSSISTTGADVTSTYTYDLADRLIGVKMGAPTGSVQNRIFDYDNRGFLRWESQPESGMTSYTYDARGHVRSRLQSGANSMFDLTYTYDAAERPLTVNGRNPADTATFRAVKEFVYGTANVTVNGVTDYRKGKLVSATRHNYGDPNQIAFYSPYGPEPEYDVQDSYGYTDPAGRRNTRTTTLSMVTLGGTSTLQSLTTSMTYDALGLPLTITYPTCSGCGTPPLDPDRHLMSRTYSKGRLQALTDYDSQSNALGYVSSFNYWPNGMRNTIVHWAAPGGHNISDSQTVTNMPRPSTLQFGTYDRCVRPTFSVQPVSTPLVNGSATLTVAAAGTAPMTYDWYNVQSGQLVGGSSSLTVQTAGDYYAVARNTCGYESSEKAHVSTDCQAPSTGDIAAVLQPDGSWILKPNTVARQGRTFSWKRLSDNAVLGTSETLAIGVQTVTTTYRLTITDSCGSASGDVTITVPVAITNGMTATWMSANGYVAVTWPAISGATQYSVERRHDGGSWEAAGTTTTLSYHDTTVASGKTYVYHVTSDGGDTNYDVATTTTFTAAVPGQVVGVTPFNEMLRAANLVRAAAGWPALDWSNILSSSDPLPSPGNVITSRQVLACRARINEALQALGVVAGEYTNPDLLNVAISATAINEVQQRAQ